MKQIISPYPCYSAFSEKHLRYLKHGLKKSFCVAEGAVRSGKTIDHCILAFLYLLNTPDKFHLATGSTIGNAKLNIGVCNGFGLENLFSGCCHWGKYRDNEALFVATPTGEKIVIFSGGGKADSYKRILGNSYGLWIATEINEHYDCDDSRTSFVKVAMARQAAAQEPLTLWDLNPSSPHHRIYGQYIDRYREQETPGFLYERFTISDNASITPEQLEAFTAKYDKSSVWYKRDILGQRVTAEGIIFRQFADNPARWTITEPPEDIRRITFGIDFGVNTSQTVFICTGIRAKGAGIVILEERMRGSKGVSPDGIERDFVTFARFCLDKYKKYKPTYCWTDQPETLTHGIYAAVKRAGLPIGVTIARKEQIKTRIYAKERMLNTGKWQVMKHCERVIFSTANQVWDDRHPGEDIRLDNDPRVNDVADAEEYSWEAFIDEMGVRA